MTAYEWIWNFDGRLCIIGKGKTMKSLEERLPGDERWTCHWSCTFIGQRVCNPLLDVIQADHKVILLTISPAWRSDRWMLNSKIRAFRAQPSYSVRDIYNDDWLSHLRTTTAVIKEPSVADKKFQVRITQFQSLLLNIINSHATPNYVITCSCQWLLVCGDDSIRQIRNHQFNASQFSSSGRLFNHLLRWKAQTMLCGSLFRQRWGILFARDTLVYFFSINSLTSI